MHCKEYRSEPCTTWCLLDGPGYGDDNISILEPGEDKTILIPACLENRNLVVEANGIGADGKLPQKSALDNRNCESGLSGNSISCGLC